MNRSDALFGAWKEIRERLGAPRLHRVNGLVEVALAQRMIGEQQLYQRINPLVGIPGLPTKPWFEREEFPWIKSLEEAHGAIKREFLHLLMRGIRFVPYSAAYDLPDGGQQRSPLETGLTPPIGWKEFTLHSAFRKHFLHCRLCPDTCSAISKVPVSREALFSILEPNGRIEEHSDGTNYVLTAHLGIVIPPRCSITVATESREWEEGRVLIFDSSFLHKAQNDSRNTRVVLIVDVWHPSLTDTEIAAISALRPALESFFDLKPRQH